VIEAAQTLNIPVILQTGSLERDFVGGCKKLYKIAKTVAADYDVPVALHYDHGADYGEVLDAVDSGYTSIMIDASHESFDDNVAVTKKVVELARRNYVSSEAELGVMAGSEGHLKSDIENQTKPQEAFDFVRATGVDCLAVAIGTAHGLYRYKPSLNIERLKEIRNLVDVPLVLHGGSATPDGMVQEAVRNGICKVNICTEFVQAFGMQYIETQRQEGFRYSVPALFAPSKKAGYELALKKMRLFAHV